MTVLQAYNYLTAFHSYKHHGDAICRKYFVLKFRATEVKNLKRYTVLPHPVHHTRNNARLSMEVYVLLYVAWSTAICWATCSGNVASATSYVTWYKWWANAKVMALKTTNSVAILYRLSWILMLLMTRATGRHSLFIDFVFLHQKVFIQVYNVTYIDS